MQATSQKPGTWKAGSMIVRSLRSLSGQPPLEAPSVVALHLPTLGRDLVRSLSEGRIADKAVDGRYVDVVSRNGDRLRVITRRAYMRECTKYPTITATVNNHETAAINFANPADKPDALILVAHNSATNSLDIFCFPAQSDGSFQGSYNVTWSKNGEGYGKNQPNLIASLTES